jgi:sulfite exporter TauE/SafE
MHVESAAAALFAGLGTGAHCALMCGPMACAFQVRPFSYHLGRLLSYGFAGVLCGLLGNAGRLVFHSPFARIAPWVLLLVLVLMEGALLLLCFAAGTVFVYAPLLAGWFRVQVSCGAERVGRMRTFLVWAAVALMAWRLSNPTSNGCCGL